MTVKKSALLWVTGWALVSCATADKTNDQVDSGVGDGDTGANADTDTDSDAYTDSDVDADADTDADSDPDWVSTWDNPEADIIVDEVSFRVDLNMSGRPEDDVNETDYLPWPVEGGDTVSQSFDGVTVAFQRVGSVGASLRSNWYKAGIQAPNYIRLAGDGLTVDGGEAGAEIQMTISGLPAGQHSLLTFHNTVDNPETNTFAPIDISVNGARVVDNLMPSNRATNGEAATAYLVFDVSAGQSVEILFAADTGSSASSKNVIINGFEINTSDAGKQATNPRPAHGDEHVDADSGSITLSWTAAPDAISHNVYIGTKESIVKHGDETVSAFRANQTGTTFEMDNLYSMKTYFWRIDEVDASGTVTKGNVWYFRPRQLAFPGAKGYGRFAIGGRGGRVVFVTNLNDDGPGSFRLEGSTTYSGSVSGLPGLPDHHNDVGGYESYPEETRPSDWDSDMDGLPDFWEKLIGTSTSSGSGDFSDAATDPDRDGYTALDDYLSWMAEPHYFKAVDQSLDIFLADLFRGYTSSSSYEVTESSGGTVNISDSTASFSSSSCGLASFAVRVTDSEESSMTKIIGVFVDAAVAGTCTTK